MKAKSKKISDSRIELTVTLDAKDLKPAREKALEIASELDSKIYHKQNLKAANSQYLLTWFLQSLS